MFTFINLSWEAIWFIALIIRLAASFEKDDRKLFLLLATCSFFYWIHFFWLWLFTASFINFFDVTKNLVALKFKKNLYVFFFYIISYTIIGGLTSHWHIIPFMFVIWSMISIYAAFFLKGIYLRLCYLITNLLYLSYSIYGWSIAWSVSSILFSISLSFSIYILFKRKWFIWKIKYYNSLAYKKVVKFFEIKKLKIKMIK